MKLAHTCESGRDVDLRSTRRRFLLAREQLAAHSSAERYFAVRDMRRWETRRAAGPVTVGR